MLLFPCGKKNRVHPVSDSKTEELKNKLDAAIEERDAAIEERDAAIKERDAALKKLAESNAMRDGDLRNQFMFLYLLEVLMQNLENYCSVLAKINSSVFSMRTHVRMCRAQIDTLSGVIDELQEKTEAGDKTLAVFMDKFEKCKSCVGELTQHIKDILAIVNMLNEENKKLNTECNMLHARLRVA